MAVMIFIITGVRLSNCRSETVRARACVCMLGEEVGGRG